MYSSSKNIGNQRRDIFAHMESNVQSYARAFPTTFDYAKGAVMWDAEGRRYLDFLTGAGSLNYGHNHPVFKQALISYIEQGGISHSLDLHTAAKAKFLRAMHDIILRPRGLDYVVQFTGPTGTNAVEAAIKLARKVTGRSNILSFTNGFHGVTLGALSLTGHQYFRKGAGIPLSGMTPMPYDGYLGSDIDTIDILERFLSDPSSGLDEPAAVIAETVQGEGGLKTARIDWLRRLEHLCRIRNILFIVDDIQAGCGRTGSFFSFEPAGIKPDIVTLSKSLSGYGLPMAVVLIARSLDQWEPGQHNGTFRGNNHAFITATAALEHYWRTPSFIAKLSEKSRHLQRRLNDIAKRFPTIIAEVRGRGMMRGICFYEPHRAALVTQAAFRNGLIIERSGPQDEVVKCLMPLTIKQSELDEGLDILEQAINDEFIVYANMREVMPTIFTTTK